jgi:hypothetical protein
MRVMSSPAVVKNADIVVRIIMETYLSPHKSFRDLKEMVVDDAVDPLRDFSNACRDELHSLSEA